MSFAQQSEVWKDLSNKLNMVICLSDEELVEAARNQKNFDCLNYTESLQITNREYEGNRLVSATFILPASVKASAFEEAILSGNIFVTTCREVAEINIINREANEVYNKKLVVDVKVDVK